MCGRYVTKTAPVQLAGQLAVDLDLTDGRWRERFNLSPTSLAPLVLERLHEGELIRELHLFHWGLVPSWAKDPKIGSRMINARQETLFDKPSFRKAARVRRCLVPADGWYEWQAGAGGRVKQPYFVHRSDDLPLAFAGIYEFWRNPEVSDGDPSAWLPSFAIITTSAVPQIAAIHDRMPLVLGATDWPDWLNPALTERADLEPLLTRPEPVSWSAYPVATRLGNVRFDDPDLMTPLE